MVWLSERKAQSDSFQIAFLMEYARPGLITHPPDRIALLHAHRVTTLVEDFLKRMAGRDHDPRLETIGKELLTLLGRIRKDPETPATAAELVQIKALSLTLAEALNPGKTVDTLTHEIAEATTEYRARMECLRAVSPNSGH